MAKKINIALFNINGCLTHEAMVAYIQKSLDGNDLKKVKQHIEGCPLCSDAAEGISGVTPAGLKEDIIQLQSRFREKTASTGKLHRLRYLSYAAAAASILIIVSVLLMYRQLIAPGKGNIAYDQSKEKAKEEIQNKSEALAPEAEEVEVSKPVPEKEPKPVIAIPVTIEADNLEYEAKADIVIAETAEADATVKVKDTPETVSTASGMPSAPSKLSLAQSEDVSEEDSYNRSRKSELVNANKAADYNAKKMMSQPGSKDIVYTFADKMPSFEGGGPEKFYSYLIDTLRKNELFITSGFKENILMNYSIDTSGRVVDIKLLNIEDMKLQKEIINIIKDSPRWLPGMQNSRRVNVSYATSLKTNP
ncbi:MAG: hypothetical protein R6W78_09910 [Bacteroidales bacterium]